MKPDLIIQTFNPIKAGGNLKDFTHRVGYRAVKSPECLKKKSKIAHNFFMTKAIDLKTIFLKSP